MNFWRLPCLKGGGFAEGKDGGIQNKNIAKIAANAT